MRPQPLRHLLESLVERLGFCRLWRIVSLAGKTSPARRVVRSLLPSRSVSYSKALLEIAGFLSTTYMFTDLVERLPVSYGSGLMIFILELRSKQKCQELLVCIE